MDESKVMNTLVRDFLGLLALALTVFALVALATYSPSDPSFSHKFSEKAVAVNSGGMIGAYLSDGLAQVFGSGAFFFPLVTVALGWALIRGREVRAWPLVLGPGIFLLIGVCALVGILSHTDPFFKAGVPPGGMIGTLLGHFMLKWLSTVGAILVLSALILFCVIAMTGITVNMLIEAIGKGAQWGIEQVKALALRIRSRIEERIKRLEERKTETKKAARKKAEPVIVTRQPVFPVAPAVPVAPDRASPPKPEKKARPEPGDFVVQQDFDFITELGDYRVPPLSLLDDPPPHGGHERAREEILASSAILEKKLADFGIEGKVVQVLPGPLITLFEFEPAPGIKVSRILSLTDDLALALRAMSLRILAPVPGKPVVGIEVPNLKRETIYFKDIISSETFAHSKSKLSMVIGKDTVGEPVVEDLATVPHLLIAGSTGSGKSVGLNAMICSILLNASPDEVKFIMVDPKMLELSIYDGIPHLISPVVTNPKKAAAALQWAVKEMENRYKLMAEKGVRNIGGYNHAIDKLHR
ncbi:MAG: cell division protein FtsK, partial [Nitrospinae bacterium CG11_big_fil_rev_8_21_14_0_20_56_8]